MPLKHFTETFLVVVLGAVIALTGLLISTLPSLPEGALPWAVLFVLSIVYPLSLLALFQRRRADNTFRNLHWFPAAMLLVWLLLQGIVLGSSVELSQVSLYSWGWTLGAVLVGFVLIVLFCLNVIRRRVPRLAFLGLILVPFVAAAVISEQQGHWEQEVASVLWGADFWSTNGSDIFASLLYGESTSSEPNLEPSSDEQEEDWRERLRMQERRDERIASRMANEKEEGQSSSIAIEKSNSSMSTILAYESSSSKPTKLPSSGFGWNIIILSLLAGYCATLQKSSQKRVES